MNRVPQGLTQKRRSKPEIHVQYQPHKDDDCATCGVSALTLPYKHAADVLVVLQDAITYISLHLISYSSPLF